MMKKLLVCFALFSQSVMRPVQAEPWFTGLVAGAGLTLFALDGARDYKKFKRHGDRKMLQGHEKAQSENMMHDLHALPAGNRSFLLKNKEAFIASFKDFKQFFNYYCKEVPKKRLGFFHVGLGMMAASLLQAKTGRDYEGEIVKINQEHSSQQQEKALRLEQDIFNEQEHRQYCDCINHLNQVIIDFEAQPPVIPLRNEDAVELDRLRQESEDLGSRVLTLQKELDEYKEWNEVFYSQQQEVTEKWILIEKLKEQLNENQKRLYAAEEKYAGLEEQKQKLIEDLRLTQEALNRTNASALSERQEAKQELENRIKDLEAKIARLQSDLAAESKLTSHARGRGNARGRGELRLLPKIPAQPKEEKKVDDVVSDEKKETPVVDDSKKEAVDKTENKVEHFGTFVNRDLLDSCFFGEAEVSNEGVTHKEGESSSSVSVVSSSALQPIEYAEDFSLPSSIPVEDSSPTLLSEKPSVSIQTPLASDLTQKVSEEDLSVAKSEKTENKVEKKEDRLPNKDFKNVLSSIKSFSSGSLKKEAPIIEQKSTEKDEDKIPKTDVLPGSALNLILTKGQQVAGTGIYTGPQETVYNDAETNWGSMVFDNPILEPDISDDSKHKVDEKKEKEEDVQRISPKQRLTELGINENTVLTYNLVVAIKTDPLLNQLYPNLTDDQKGQDQWVKFDKEHKIELKRIQDEQDALERERNASTIQALAEGSTRIAARGNVFDSGFMNQDLTDSAFWNQ